MDGNINSGYFFLGASDVIPHDASTEEMESAIEKMSVLVTFKNVDELIPSSSLVGKDASISVAEFRRAVLEDMNSLGHVKVTMSGVINLEEGQTLLVTFLDADIGDAEILCPNTVGLSGLGKAVTVREEIKG
eukprot:15255823-Ditylum_brightwellii.AAC.1